MILIEDDGKNVKSYKLLTSESLPGPKSSIRINPRRPYYHYILARVYFKLGKNTNAIDSYQAVIKLAPGYVLAKADLSKGHFLEEHFQRALVLANHVLNQKDITTEIPTDLILAMKFLSISSQLFQEKNSEGAAGLREFIKYYKSLKSDYPREWEFNTFKRFIAGNTILLPKTTRLLLKLIDLLESSKPEGEKKSQPLKTHS